MQAIETEKLTKDYAVGFWRPRPYRALDSLSLQVGRNEVFGFLGPNGRARPPPQAADGTDPPHVGQDCRAREGARPS